MDAVTSALAQGEITPGEAETIAGVVDAFVRAIKQPRRTALVSICCRFLTAGDDDEEIPRMIPMAENMKKPANMKKPMIAIRSART